MVRRSSDQGMALVSALLLMTLLGAMTASLSMLAAGELRVSATHRHSLAARYAAETAVAVAVAEITRVTDWNALLAGAVISGFADGAASGTRQTPSGPIDLGVITNVARCGRSVCTSANIASSTADRPWGPNNPLWQPFVYGRLRDLLGVESDAYVVVWVGDDASECDGRPDLDGGPCEAGDNPGRDVLALRGAAYGLAGVVPEVEVTVGRDGPGGRVRLLSWRLAR